MSRQASVDMDAGWWLAVAGGVLVAEGLMPLLLPQAWRDTVQRLSGLRDGQLRFLGLAAVLGGLLLISL